MRMVFYGEKPQKHKNTKYYTDFDRINETAIVKYYPRENQEWNPTNLQMVVLLNLININPNRSEKEWRKRDIYDFQQERDQHQVNQWRIWNQKIQKILRLQNR